MALDTLRVSEKLELGEAREMKGQEVGGLGGACHLLPRS